MSSGPRNANAASVGEGTACCTTVSDGFCCSFLSSVGSMGVYEYNTPAFGCVSLKCYTYIYCSTLTEKINE